MPRLRDAATKHTLAPRARLLAVYVASRWEQWRFFDRRPLDTLLGPTPRVRTAPTCSAPAAGRDLRRAEWLLRRLAPATDTCLHRSVARFRALVAAGHTPRFSLGVRDDAGEPRFHAWVELDDAPFLDATASAFRPFFRYPPG